MVPGLVTATPAGAAVYANANAPIWQTTGGGLVRALATNGPRVFLGGSFAGMRSGPGGANIAQGRLAAVDATTGALIAGFAPQLNGEVRALVMAPDNSMLYVAGTFTTVNGAARRALVALDPATGATIASFTTNVNHDVLDLAIDGPHLYLVGRFWNVANQSREKVARIDRITGALDPTWAPMVDAGTAASVAVDPILDRVYIGGFFSGVANAPNTQFLGAVSRSTGAVVSSFDPAPEGEVYDLLARPGRLYAATGGPGGRLEIFDTVGGSRIAGWFGDGDLQVLAASGTDVYAGGHHDTGLGDGPDSPVARVVGSTDDLDITFGPIMSYGQGLGIWGLLATPTHLWVGGAITDASPAGAVGIARYPIATADPVDTTAPTVPGAPVVNGTSDITARLSWAPSTDASATVEYVIVRDGVPIGATRAASFIDTSVVPSRTYAYRLRAVDLSGNVSALTGAVSATTLGPLTEITPFGLGATWSYLDTGPAPAATWPTAAFDAAAWPTGPGEFGRGDGDEATIVANRPVTYVRRLVVLGPDQAVAAATIRYRRDDGVVIRVNGTEVVRDNVAAGPITHTTAAVETLFGLQETEIVEADIDPSLFVAGTNVIAVTVHNVAGSGDISFDAGLRLRVGSLGADTTAPTAPGGLAAEQVTEGSVRLRWTAATDNVAVTGYDIRRGGVVVGTTATTTFSEGGLAPATAYTYTVVARDAAGNIGPAAGPLNVTTSAAPAGDVTLVGPTTAWRIDDSGSAPPTDWRTSAGVPATWSSGRTEIGAGDGGETTVIRNRPVVHLRTTFDIGDPAAVSALTLDLLADDGAVVTLNGTEVVRDNVAPGPVDQTTPAASYRSSRAEETTLLRWPIPTGTLRSGANVLAISLHNGAGSSDLSFDAVLTAGYGTTPDTEPPAAPTGVEVTTVTASAVTLRWTAPFDNVGVTGYRILRDGNQVGQVAARDFTDTGLAAGTGYTYTVRAFDAAGNVGPASAPRQAFTQGAVTEPLPLGTVWRYRDSGIDPGPTWNQPGFNDSSWAQGPAELGAGDGDEATVVINRPVVWFRTTVSIADPATLARATLSLRADDGAVIYVNGVEVGRDNVGPGPVTATTPAASYRSSRPDETALRDFAVGPSAFVAGTNVIAISVHNGPGSSDLSFAARLAVEGAGAADTVAPSVPAALRTTAVGQTEVSLAWDAATDNVGVDRYEVRRDGAVVTSTSVTSFTDRGLTPSTTLGYQVRAIDAAGNAGPWSPTLSVTTSAPPPPVVRLVALDASWRYLDTTTAPAATWTTVGFDDTSWSAGRAELGAGDGDEATVVANRRVVWFRNSFTVTDPPALTTLTLELLADDGAVVYLNGVEVVRDNVSPGPVGPTTAAASVRSGAAEAAVRSFTLPPAALVAGSNVIAVSVHNTAGSSDLSFAAALVAQ